MKKLFTILSFSIFFLVLILGLSACNDGKDPQSKNISFNTLNVEGDTVYGKVSNETTEFSFLEEISSNDSTQYVVSLDVYGVHTIVTKVVPLIEGDNVFYVIETNGDKIKTYTVTIRRRPIYTVFFQENGGSNVESQLVEEDSLAYEPTTVRAGYSFSGWNYDFNTPITKNEHITANWVANTNTSYKVEYYHQNLYDDNYTLFETVIDTGTTDNEVTAEIKEYNHFTYNANKSTSSGIISGYGNTTLKIYYNRQTYKLTINNFSAGEITNSGNYKYGGNVITSTATPYLGYVFVGWYCEEKLLSTDNAYVFTPENDVTAKFAVKTEMSNFSFTSNTITCIITGVNDLTTTEVSIPNYITGIGDRAFYGCKNITNIIIPDSVTNIGKEAFYDCYKLSNITISNNVINIGESAFRGCGFINVVIPDSVTSITSYVFNYCTNLRSITLGSGIKSISAFAFMYCYSLENIQFNGTVSQWLAISKGYVWNSYMKATYVQCIDGTVSI